MRYKKIELLATAMLYIGAFTGLDNLFSKIMICTGGIISAVLLWIWSRSKQPGTPSRTKRDHVVATHSRPGYQSFFKGERIVMVGLALIMIALHFTKIMPEDMFTMFSVASVAYCLWSGYRWELNRKTLS